MTTPTPPPNIQCRTCHDSMNRPTMIHISMPGDTPTYIVQCPNKCMEPVYKDTDIPFRDFPVAFRRYLDQPHTGQLAHDDPRNFFYAS